MSILRVIVFVSGGVLLSLEVIASRVLAPCFGNSIYVWGSLISVFLAALSAGYFLGGRIADRHPSPAVFAAIVLFAGILTLPIPLLSAPVLAFVASIDFGPQLNPLLGAVILFAVPSTAMGMISPFAVRLRASEVRTVGQTAGSLYALSTVGSIAGTLLTSFVLINYLGVRAIIYVMGIVLVAMAALGWWGSRRRLAVIAGVGAGVLVVVGIARSASPALPAALYARDTVYHRITVSDEGPNRYLRLDDHWQGGVDRDHPRRMVFGYSTYFHLPLLFVARPARVALIGLGAGTVPARYVDDYPTVEMSVAEIDPEVVVATDKYFDVRPRDRLTIDARDGRLHVRLLREPQDIILTDAYLIDTIPFHLATREFFALARSRLAPHGVVASNVIGALEGPRSRLFRAIYKTFREVFHTVYVFPVRAEKDDALYSVRNIIVIGADEPPLDAGELLRRAQELVERRVVTVDGLVDAARSLYQTPIPTSDVPVITDDFAPIDALLTRR